MDLEETDTPGGDDFVDVRCVFEEAARDMQPGELVFTDGFTIQDAMSAIEIGEPRMDSGMVPEAMERPEFQPLTPLLPEEVCWILDRSLACEMEWHSGNALAQTIYTMLYVHHLHDIDPDLAFDAENFEQDPSRPLELITIVIRSAVMGLLKCCDLAWRELSKNRVYEGEDWQGEKCEISLLEGYPVKAITKLLDHAGHWVRTSIEAMLRNELLARLMFRKTLIELMTLHLPEDHEKLQAHLTTARGLLRGFKTRPVRTPPPGSPALLVFDPYVTRRLHSFMPLRPIQLPAQSKAWDSIEATLDSWQELYHLSMVSAVSTWKVLGQIRIWTSKATRTIPFVRSLTQSFFYDGASFVGRFQDHWIIDRFCEEMIGVKHEWIRQLVQRSWRGEGNSPLVDIQRLMIKTIMPYFRSFWHNLPHQRRFLSKSLLDWHVLYAAAHNMLRDCHTEDDREAHVLNAWPTALLAWRLEIIREVVLSGFQLELYNSEETSMAYWYACQVTMAHLDCLDTLLAVAPSDSSASSELSFQRSFLMGLHDMCLATALLTRKSLAFSWERSYLNFQRRYKWAFTRDYNDVPLEPVAQPNFQDYMTWRDAETSTPPDSLFKNAQTIFLELVESPAIGWAGLWCRDRLDFVSNLADICGRMADKPVDERSVFRYDADASLWFPMLS